MAGTILSYLDEYGDRDLGTLPLNDVDALILCQLAYLKFDGLVPDVNVHAKPVRLRDLQGSDRRDDLFSDERYEKVNRELFSRMVSGRRFGDLGCNAYVNLVEKEWETQFSAITFQLENGFHFLAFRGTDENIVGWKEDFNMAFLSPIPAQHCAQKYCNLVASRTRRDFYLGGHSKGGNLAVYAGMHCAPPLQHGILKIYNMDGPGFRTEVRKQDAYEKIKEKVIKILPHSSLIGMMFEQSTDYQVVESNALGLLQHDPYSWLVEDNHFVEVGDLYEGRKFLDETINEWLDSLTIGETKAFVEALFQILEASKAESLIELGADKKKSMLAMAEAMKELDPEISRMMGEVLKQLFEIAGRKALQEIDQKVKSIGDGKKNKKKE